MVHGISNHGIFTTDAALVIGAGTGTSRNRRLPAGDVVGRPLFDVLPDLVARGLDVHFRAALEGEARILSHHFHRYLIPARSGAPERAQSARIAPLEIDGAIVGVITIVEDVSERVASERELRSQTMLRNGARARRRGGAREGRVSRTLVARDPHR